MKQYTTPEQTAKIIELGFEKPKMAAPALKWVDGEPTFEPQYTIGELFEMLPREYNGELLEILAVSLTYSKWRVRYPYGIIINKKELIDALYDMIIMLKEEGVI